MEHPSPTPSGELAGLAVLVVEDEPDAADLLRQITASVGAQVLTARDGMDALRLLATHHVDLVLVDLRMPLMDGFELIARIRREPGPLRRLPVIAITALGRDEDLFRTWNEGADAHLTKPVDYDIVLAVIRRVMAMRQSQRRPWSRRTRRSAPRPDS